METVTPKRVRNVQPTLKFVQIDRCGIASCIDIIRCDSRNVFSSERKSALFCEKCVAGNSNEFIIFVGFTTSVKTGPCTRRLSLVLPHKESGTPRTEEERSIEKWKPTQIRWQILMCYRFAETWMQLHRIALSSTIDFSLSFVSQ